MKLDEATIESSIAKMEAVLRPGTDLTLLLLKGHLYAEGRLERIISLRLSRGDRLIETGHLSFAQKLAVVDALNEIPDQIITVLKNLNKLRNQCAHELEKEVGDADVDRLGQPLGARFTELKQEARVKSKEIADPIKRGVVERLLNMNGVIATVCGFLAGACLVFEGGDKNAGKLEDQERRE